MSAQMPLPLQPAEGVPIGDAAALVTGEHGSTVRVRRSLWWSWPAGDEADRRLAAVQLVRAKVATRVQVGAAFKVATVTLWRWGQASDTEGVGGLVPSRSGPKGGVEGHQHGRRPDRGVAGQAGSQAQITEQVGVSRSSVRRVLESAEEIFEHWLDPKFEGRRSTPRGEKL